MIIINKTNNFTYINYFFIFKLQTNNKMSTIINMISILYNILNITSYNISNTNNYSIKTYSNMISYIIQHYTILISSIFIMSIESEVLKDQMNFENYEDDAGYYRFNLYTYTYTSYNSLFDFILIFFKLKL